MFIIENSMLNYFKNQKDLSIFLSSQYKFVVTSIIKNEIYKLINKNP